MIKRSRYQLIAIFFFVSFLFHPYNIFAEAPTPIEKALENEIPIEEQYFTMFQKLFFSAHYNSLKCQNNIYMLLKKIKQNGIPLDELNVIFIFDKNHHKLRPLKSFDEPSYSVQRPTITTHKTRRVATRNDPPNHFRYHVFAEVNCHILDSDYTNSPTLVPTETYFEEMFLSEGIRLQEKRTLHKQLKLRIIKAEDYKNEYPQHTSYYLYDLKDKYPSQSLESYLKEIQLRKEAEKES